MQPSPVDFVPEPAGPRVVDGRVLKPSDRFNPCHLTYRVEPTYPLEAQQQGLQGTVKIHLVIAADGSISSEKFISGPSQLAPAALEAAKYWRYFPRCSMANRSRPRKTSKSPSIFPANNTSADLNGLATAFPPLICFFPVSVGAERGSLAYC